jgi:putative ABC transport system substrate-binding protein
MTTRRAVWTVAAVMMVAAPLAWAQRPAMPVIGFLSGRGPDDSAGLVASFRRGLGEVGFVEGQNVVIEFRWASGEYARLPALAAQLTELRVTVLVGVGGDPSARAATQASKAIPVVFGMGSDPVGAGLVNSLSRPGGNATGFTLLTNEMEPKRLGLLREMVPGVSLIGVLVNPNFPPAVHQVREVEDAARKMNQRLLVATASNDIELENGLASLANKKIGALLVAADPYFDTRRQRIIAFASRNRLPAIYQFREWAVAGGLASYGPNITDAYRQAGVYVGRILKGTKPAELPVLRPTNFEFVINVKAATRQGFDFPSTVRIRADEVIE